MGIDPLSVSTKEWDRHDEQRQLGTRIDVRQSAERGPDQGLCLAGDAGTMEVSLTCDGTSAYASHVAQENGLSQSRERSHEPDYDGCTGCGGRACRVIFDVRFVQGGEMAGQGSDVSGRSRSYGVLALTLTQLA